MPPVLLSAIHAFQVRTLRALGFSTRVSLINKSNTEAKWTTDYRVDVTVYDHRGFVARSIADVGRIAPGETFQLDCDPYATEQDDSLLTFHMIPLRLAAQSRDGVSVAIDMGELMYLVTAQDQYVEYYRPDGFASGVLYISAAMNQRSAPERTTMIQAPKIHVGGDVTTYMSLMHPSPDTDYSTVAELKCRLTAPDGRIVARWTEHIGPFKVALIDLRSKLDVAPTSDQFFTFHGLSRNASLIPLTMNYDEKHHTLAVEHSLPPTYYGTGVKGPVRSSVIEALARSELFS